MATRKYLTAIGCLALPTLSIPLSKFANLSAVARFGPRKWVTPIITQTNAIANKSCSAIGKYQNALSGFCVAVEICKKYIDTYWIIYKNSTASPISNRLKFKFKK